MDDSQGQRGIHEDEVMGVSLDAALAKEEAAEQDVVSQLRLRAASLERDLLQRSWDGLAPSSKVQCLHPLTLPSCLCILREYATFICLGIDPHGRMCKVHCILLEHICVL